jgi:hypothetical protein
MVSVVIDSGGTNAVTLVNCLITEDLASRWSIGHAVGGTGYDSALSAADGSNGRAFSVFSAGLGYHAKYHLEQIGRDSAPVNFEGHPVMYDSAGDSATAAIKVVLLNPHFEVAGASTDTAVWSFTCQLVEVT